MFMTREQVWEYAHHVIGFSVRPGTEVVVDEDCTGRDNHNIFNTTNRGAIGKITSIKMGSHPDQLTIVVKIPIGDAGDTHIRQVFSERRKFPSFPLKSVKIASADEKEPETPQADANKATQEQANDIPFDIKDNRPSDDVDMYHDMYSMG